MPTSPDGPAARSAARPRPQATLPVVVLLAAVLAVALSLSTSGGGPFGTARRGLEVLLLGAAVWGVWEHVARRRPGRERAGWIALGGAMLAGLVASLSLVSDPDAAVRVGRPAVNDGAALLMAPLIIVGVGLFAGRARNARQGARIMLDAVAISVSSAIVAWSLVLRPVVEAGDLREGTLGITVAYLAGDAIAVAVGGLALSRARLHLRGAVAWVLLGLALLLLSDLLGGMRIRSGSDSTYWAAEITWICALAAFALAAWRREPSVVETEQMLESRAWSAWLTMPYLFLMPVAAVLFVAAVWDEVDMPMVIGAAVLIGTLGFRHVLALHENLALTQRLAVSVRQLEHRAEHDDLTGLLNRRGLIDRIDRIGGELARQVPAALLFVDVDRFKGINDTLGHAVGDAVLRTIGERLRYSLGGQGLAARFAGDEFVLLLPGTGSEHEALVRAQAALELVERPITLADGAQVVVTASVGVAITQQLGDGEAIVREADLAMFEAKQNGRARVQVFEEGLRDRSQDRLRIEQDLRRALRSPAEFEVHFQPIVDLRTGQRWGAEALIRWRHPELGLLYPGRFLSVAEESGLIVRIGYRVLEEACAVAASVPDLVVSVNLSPRQIHDPALVPMIRQQLEAHDVPADRLCVEVVEDVLVDDRTIGVLESLQGMGAHVAIDDFGVGASSLRQLRRVPGAIVKVDRSFAEHLDDEAGGDDRVMVRALVAIADQLDLQVVGEGIERVSQATALQELGVGLGQGWHIGMPERAERFVGSCGGTPLADRAE